MDPVLPLELSSFWWKANIMEHNITNLQLVGSDRRDIIVRGQSYFYRLPKYWPPIPLSARRVCPPPATKAGGTQYTLAGRRGGWGSWGVNILEDDRNRIALLQWSLYGSDPAMRLYADRTCLFRLINTKNGPPCSPPSSAINPHPPLPSLFTVIASGWDFRYMCRENLQKIVVREKIREGKKSVSYRQRES